MISLIQPLTNQAFNQTIHQSSSKTRQVELIIRIVYMVYNGHAR